VLPLQSILDIYFEYCATYEEHLLGVCFMPMIVHFSSMPIFMPHGRVIHQIDIQSLIIFHGTSPLTWKSKKQAIVSHSSTEVKLHALATTTAEIVWLRWLLADFGIVCADSTLLCDNTGAIHIANDLVKHELQKHIGVDAFFTRSHCHQKTIALQYVPSELQLTDFFTKAQT
jgi:hypothetical protein